MNHEANTIQWKVGDLVLHDADRKDASMLMKVIKIQKNGKYITKYISEYMKNKWPSAFQKKWKNDVSQLHDPARFGVTYLPPEPQEDEPILKELMDLVVWIESQEHLTEVDIYMEIKKRINKISGLYKNDVEGFL